MRQTPPATLTYEIFSTCYHPPTSDCDLDARLERGERKDGDNNRFWFLSSHLQAICFCYKAKCVNSHKTCSISLLSCLDLITISKPFLSPIGGPQEKRVKSRLLPFTAKPKSSQQRMKLEYKRMKLNTTNYCTYVPNFCVFCRLFYVLQLHHSDLFFFAHGLLYKSSKLSLVSSLKKSLQYLTWEGCCCAESFFRNWEIIP